MPDTCLLPTHDFARRSLLNLAKENKLTESFLWIPSLEGPTFDSPPTEMMSWIKDWSGTVATTEAMHVVHLAINQPRVR